MIANEPQEGGQGPRPGWTSELGEAFLALLRQTGNTRASARALGPRHWFLNRARRDPVFRAGRTTRGRRKGPPERSFDEAVASVLAKVAAIERKREVERESRREEAP